MVSIPWRVLLPSAQKCRCLRSPAFPQRRTLTFHSTPLTSDQALQAEQHGHQPPLQPASPLPCSEPPTPVQGLSTKHRVPAPRARARFFTLLHSTFTAVTILATSGLSVFSLILPGFAFVHLLAQQQLLAELCQTRTTTLQPRSDSSFGAASTSRVQEKGREAYRELPPGLLCWDDSRSCAPALSWSRQCQGQQGTLLQPGLLGSQPSCSSGPDPL